MNSFLLGCEVFSFIFLKNPRPEKTFRDYLTFNFWFEKQGTPFESSGDAKLFLNDQGQSDSFRNHFVSLVKFRDPLLLQMKNW